LTIKQLEAFFWAAKLGSFSLAAARLCVTQSSLSKRIAELETDLGKPLFDRAGQRAVITDAGVRLLEHAGRMLELESLIRSDLDTQGTLRGSCRFGISELVASTWFPAFVARVRREHPQLVLEPHVELTSKLERMLERGELDFAIVPGPSASPNLSHEKIGELEYRWMASPERLPAGTVLTPAHFSEHPMITLSADARLSREVERWRTDVGVAIPHALICNSLAALITLVMAGVGISTFPTAYVAPFLASGRLVALVSDPPPYNLSYCFHWRTDDPRAVVRVLREIVRAEANFLMPSPLWPTAT